MMRNQKGFSPILLILLVIVGLFVVGQVIYKFKLLPVKPYTVKPEDVVQDDQQRDLTCTQPLAFSLEYPKDATASAERKYDNDLTCFFVVGNSNYNIFIAPAGKFNEWGAYGPDTKFVRKAYSVSIGDQVAKGEEVSISNSATPNQSRVILKGIKGYDFGITFYNQDKETKKQVSDVLKSFKLSN